MKAWTANEVRRGLELAADTALSWGEVAAALVDAGFPRRGVQATRKTLVRAGAPVRAERAAARMALGDQAEAKASKGKPAAVFSVLRPSRVTVELIAGGIRVDIRPIRGE